MAQASRRCDQCDGGELTYVHATSVHLLPMAVWKRGASHRRPRTGVAVGASVSQPDTARRPLRIQERVTPAAPGSRARVGLRWLRTCRAGKLGIKSGEGFYTY